MVAGRGPQALNEVVIDEVKARNNNLRVGDRSNRSALTIIVSPEFIHLNRARA